MYLYGWFHRFFSVFSALFFPQMPRKSLPQVRIESRNGKAMQITVPAGGFVILNSFRKYDL
jgi:hypothetical protein